jgi:hypothetical protein
VRVVCDAAGVTLRPPNSGSHYKVTHESQREILTIGPTFGAGQDLATMVGGAASRDVSQGDVRAMRRLMPYQNLFWIGRMLRAGEEGVMDPLGVPEKRRN